MSVINVPDILARVLEREDAALWVSISGGKDGQAMLVALAKTYAERSWRCGFFVIHADLGRAEWPQSMAMCQRVAAEHGVPLKVVNRPQGDLLQQIQDRQAKLTGTGRSAWPTATQRYCTADQKRGQIEKAKRQPFWPDAANRYCTSDQKRGQIDKALRGYSLVVSAIGMRAQESKPRAKRVAFSIDRTLTAKAFRELEHEAALGAYDRTERIRPLFGKRQRLAFDWLAIHDWTIDQVWKMCGTSVDDLTRRRELYEAGEIDAALGGWPCHPADVVGNERVSCVFCVLASRNDLRVGALHNPELYRTYVQMERESGFTFQHKKPLSDVAPELLDADGAA